MNWLRQSFGAKLLAALVGTVGLLLAITLLVVRSQTNREVRTVEDRTVRSAAELFDQLNELQRQQADQLARPFTEGMRTLALLDEAIRSRDLEYLQGEIEYELLRSGLGESGDALVALTDDEAQPVIFMIGGTTAEGDPADIEPLADALLQSDSLTWSDYRVLDGRLYYVQAHYIELARRPIGTITFGLPLRSDDIDAIAGIGGFEVCLLVDAGCVARSTGVAPEMEAAMVSAPATGTGFRTELDGEGWSIQYEPLSAARPGSGQRIVAGG